MSQAAGKPDAFNERAWRLVQIGLVVTTLVLFLTTGWVGALIGLLSLLGTPLFAIMGGTTELAWLSHPDATYHHLRYLAPKVLDEQFAGSPILVTIPLFTFVGYLMAESKTPDRIVRAARAWLSWLPGGLALVCLIASAFFNIVSSGVTIVAIGGLLYPTLRKQGYPEKFSLALVTIGGSLGFLIPPSLPILIYALIAGVDFNKIFKAGFYPGCLIFLLLYVYSAYIAIKHKVPRQAPNLREMGASLWELKWELFIPVLILGGLGTGLCSLDESAALAALYTFLIEVYVYRDLSLKKDIPRVAKTSMALGGALILILAMANALINYVIQEQIPTKILEALVSFGLTQKWQFLIVLNLFLLLLGMIMEGFSAIFVAVPLIIPFAAKFHLSPFHVAMMFLLSLEIAFCMPPLGLNLFIASFRFNRPVVSLYRLVMPMVGILSIGLVLVMYVPSLSTKLIEPDIRKAREQAALANLAPRDAWQLECVQDDPNNPLPCTEEERNQWFPRAAAQGPSFEKSPAHDEPAPNGKQTDDDLMHEMMGGDDNKPGPAGGGAKPKTSDDDLMREMMGGAAVDGG